ncbi:TcaA 3rd/4th domain-containing protein [Lactobacillus helveticus]|uniref:TcaA 3rd/4th domain-containing protein n=1 Tax=Lactobacillus helveticus TaxID=1587 RepID=UPI00197C08C4|nr:zinc ribbon domain-containing protein [Lactobacillus helveticus]MBN6050295.1 zinc-ribbon domain-containing protein [Lactobacillus helveticus]
MKKICPNCGKEVDPEEKYCPFCHFNLVNNDETMVTVNIGLLGLKNNESTKKDEEKIQSEKKESDAKPEKKKQPEKAVSKSNEDKKRKIEKNEIIPSPLPPKKKPMPLPKSKKKKFHFKWSILIEIVVAVIAILVMVGTNYYSCKAQISRIETGLKNGEVNNVVTNGKVPLTAKNLTPLKEYYKNNPAAYKKLKKSLMGKNNLPIKLIKQGHYFLFFPRYVVQLPTYELNVVNDYHHSTVTVNGMKFVKKQKVFPGAYNIEAKSSYLGQIAKFKKTVNVWKDQTAEVNLNAKTIKVQGMPNGKLYLNNHNIGKLDKKGNLVLEDVPLTKPFSMYVAKKQKGKLVKTKQVRDVPAVIKGSKNVAVLKLDWQQSKNVGKLLEDNFNYPNSKDFIGGSKNKSYVELRTLVSNWRNSPNLTKYHANITVNNKSLNDIRYSVEFNFAFNKNGKRYKRVQVMKFRSASARSTSKGLKIKTIGGGRIVSSK